MYANRHGFIGAAHNCPPPDEDGFFSDCNDRNHCSVDVLSNGEAYDYGPWPGYSIDTTKLFTVRADYHESDGWWSSFSITLTQGENSVVMSYGDCPYLQPMTWQLNRGMTFVMSN